MLWYVNLLLLTHDQVRMLHMVGRIWRTTMMQLHLDWCRCSSNTNQDWRLMRSLVRKPKYSHHVLPHKDNRSGCPKEKMLHHHRQSRKTHWKLQLGMLPKGLGRSRWNQNHMYSVEFQWRMICLQLTRRLLMAFSPGSKRSKLWAHHFQSRRSKASLVIFCHLAIPSWLRSRPRNVLHKDVTMLMICWLVRLTRWRHKWRTTFTFWSVIWTAVKTIC